MIQTVTSVRSCCYIQADTAVMTRHLDTCDNTIACRDQDSNSLTHLVVPSLGTALSATSMHAFDSFLFIPKWEQNLRM